MKSEPEVYSIDDLARDKKTWWDSIRNYQARNFMMNSMSLGDEFLFYHSNADPPGVAGVGRISAKAEPDPTQFDKKSKYYDEAATRDKPRWFCSQVSFVEKFKNFVSLDEIRKIPALKNMPLLQRGQRLSIQPVTEKEFEIILKMGRGQ